MDGRAIYIYIYMTWGIKWGCYFCHSSRIQFFCHDC